jgi:hypothetical protein
MYTTNLELFKTKQRELHRQATEFRLAKSLEQSYRSGMKRSLPLNRLIVLHVQTSKKWNNTAG